MSILYPKWKYEEEIHRITEQVMIAVSRCTDANGLRLMVWMPSSDQMIARVKVMMHGILDTTDDPGYRFVALNPMRDVTDSKEGTHLDDRHSNRRRPPGRLPKVAHPRRVGKAKPRGRTTGPRRRGARKRAKS